MGEFCEFEIDFEQFDDLRAVVVHDECGAHEDVWFYRFDGLKHENAKLRELCADLYAEMITYSDAPNYNASVWAPKMRELGIEV